MNVWMTSVIGFQIPVWENLHTGHQAWKLIGVIGTKMAPK